jgi:hypothetical protein
VNSRLVLLESDGSFARSVPVSLSLPRFVAVDDASIFVLDGDVDMRLASFDWQGTPLRTDDIATPQDVVTGLFCTADGPCVEVAHESVFLVQRASGPKAAAAEKATLRATVGRPVDRDLGKAVKVTFHPKEGMRLTRYAVDKTSLRGLQAQATSPRLRGGRAIEHLISVDGDGRGGVIIGARLLRTGSDPSGGPSLIVGRLAADAGRSGGSPVLTDTLTLSDSSFAYLGQPFVVAPHGNVYQPSGDSRGYTLFVYALPGPAAATEPAIDPEVKP